MAKKKVVTLDDKIQAKILKTAKAIAVLCMDEGGSASYHKTTAGAKVVHRKEEIRIDWYHCDLKQKKIIDGGDVDV